MKADFHNKNIKYKEKFNRNGNLKHDFSEAEVLLYPETKVNQL